MNSRFAAGVFFVFAAATTASAYTDLTPSKSYHVAVNRGAHIIDVRTAAEFIWVGHPDVPNVINISWEIDRKGKMEMNPSFVADVDKIFGGNKDAHLIIMCRSGARSRDAAAALEAAGYTHVSNMLEGFEGETSDGSKIGYRTVNGWKNSGLPGHTSSVGADDYYKD